VFDCTQEGDLIDAALDKAGEDEADVEAECEGDDWNEPPIFVKANRVSFV
jgi:hypothetical protein